MKNKYFIICASAALLLGAAATSCTEGNDWDVDSSFNRLFTPTSLSVTRGDTYAVVDYGKIEGADYYQIEVSRDTLYQDDVSGSSTVFETTESPFTVTGLAGETDYFLRMRSCSNSGTPASKWFYYIDGSSRHFTTRPEQIMFPVTDADRDDSWIRFSWTPGVEVTHFIINGGAFNNERLGISDDEKAAGEKIVTGLAPTTTYSVILYNGDARRGNATGTTAAAIPAASYKYTMPEGETHISQDLIKQLAAAAQEAAGSANCSVTLALQPGVTYSLHGTSEDGSDASIKFPDGLSITFFGLAGSAKPIIAPSKSINLVDSHAYIRFQNVEITDGRCQYLINQSAACTIAELSFEDCYIHDFERSIIRTQGSTDQKYELLKFDNCIGYNLSTANGYSQIYIGQDKSIVDELIITNSTFNTAQRSFIEASRSPIVKGIKISYCTFYNIIASGRYFADCNGMDTNITISYCVFGKTFDPEASRGARSNGTIDAAVKNFRAADCVFGSNNITDLEPSELTSAQIFNDPDNGDFSWKMKFYDENIGDPRWIPTDD
ncbi:MAG: DUF5123 domain-containing protein [Bacteroidales bacterium]|nr:DUF5123 domain-containing protein [Bacteroidales bacterium]